MYAKRYIACMHCFDVKPGVLEGDLQTFPDHQKPANFHPKLDRLHCWSCRPKQVFKPKPWSSPDPHQQIMSTATKEKQKLNPNKRNVANVAVVLQKCTFSGDWVRWTPTKRPTNCHQILILVLRLRHDRFKPMRKAENSNVKSEKNAYNLAENDVFHA